MMKEQQTKSNFRKRTFDEHFKRFRFLFYSKLDKSGTYAVKLKVHIICDHSVFLDIYHEFLNIYHEFQRIYHEFLDIYHEFLDIYHELNFIMNNNVNFESTKTK